MVSLPLLEQHCTIIAVKLIRICRVIGCCQSPGALMLIHHKCNWNLLYFFIKGMWNIMQISLNAGFKEFKKNTFFHNICNCFLVTLTWVQTKKVFYLSMENTQRNHQVKKPFFGKDFQSIAIFFSNAPKKMPTNHNTASVQF